MILLQTMLMNQPPTLIINQDLPEKKVENNGCSLPFSRRGEQNDI